MTDHRGPDFLPYPLPERPAAPAYAPPPVAAAPATGRWSRALDGVPPLGVVAIGTGLAAFVLLLLVSGAADRPGAGLVVTALAGATALVTGWLALKPTVPKDSRTLVVTAQSLGVVSAILAGVVYGTTRPEGQPAIVEPTPQPSATAPAPGLLSPTPQPQLSLPPGAIKGFGVPSDPGQPLTSDPADLGTLYGHVVDTAGKPVAGATVTVERATAGDTSSTPDCPTRVTTRTDSEGVYRLQLCQLGQGLGYKVTIAVGRSVASATLFVNSGNTTVYDVILPR